MKHLHVITDLQWGSCGKGLFAGFLAKKLEPDTLITAWGPNSGHTFIDRDGNKFVNIMLPNGLVSQSVKQVLIGPGSVIDPERMAFEAKAYGLLDDARGCRLAIHEHAAVVTQAHRDAEAKYGAKIGSTMKGVGEAVIEKVSRRNPAMIAREALGMPLAPYVVSVAEYNGLLDAANVVILEGAQGFSLSINQGMYPHTTSRDCTTHQLLSDCGIPASLNEDDQRHATRVYGVARTYPIRVANRFKDCGCDPVLPGVCQICNGLGKIQIGTSGPCYPDQCEMNWSEIGIEPELTTVTKLPRRLFTFSPMQIQQAIRMNGVDSVFLNFCNYVRDPLELANMCEMIGLLGPKVRWTGWGPREDQIKELP